MGDQKQVLLQDLKDRTYEVITQTKGFKALTQEQLNWRASPNSWSILECLAHLNLYADFYLPEIKTRLGQASSSNSSNFKPGMLGNYFAKSMLPTEKLNKMKTFKDKNPLGSTLDQGTIDRFLAQQNELIRLLDVAANYDINRVKTAISISKWVKLKLGDTFRVVVYHNQRHLVQAQNTLLASQE